MLQPTSPSATPGLADIPSGSVTTTSLTSDCARPSGLSRPSSSTETVKSMPLGEDAAAELGFASIDGWKSSTPQPVIPCGFGGMASSCVKIVCESVVPSQESAENAVLIGPRQARGMVRNGCSPISTEQPTTPPQRRSGSCADAPGTPH